MTLKTKKQSQPAKGKPDSPSGARNQGKSTGEKSKSRSCIHYIDHPSFSKPGTAQKLWGPNRQKICVSSYSLLPEVEGEPQQNSAHSTLSGEEERTLFLRYNYAKYRLSRIWAKPSTPRRKKQAKLWRNRARQTRETILHANLPLVPAMAKRKRVEGVEFADKVSEGYMAILRCVEHFDVSRGFKFSTYACRGILACLYRLGTKTQTYRRYIPVQFDTPFEQDDSNRRRIERQRENAIDSVRRVLMRNDAALNEVQRKVIRQRFPVGRESLPQPLWKIGRHLGVSTERARQIKKEKKKKLRSAVETALAT